MDTTALGATAGPDTADPGTARVLAPADVGALHRVLTEHPDAQLIGGGTLAVAARQAARHRPPAVLLGSVREMQELAPGHCGAGVRLAQLVDHPLMPVALRSAAGSVGGPAVRNMATVGGNIAAAQPGCVAAVLLALDAEAATLGLDGTVRWSASADVIGQQARPIAAVRWDSHRAARFGKVRNGSMGGVVVTVAVGWAAIGPRDGSWRCAVGAGDLSVARVPAVERWCGTASREPSAVEAALVEHGLAPAHARIAAALLDGCLRAP